MKRTNKDTLIFVLVVLVLLWLVSGLSQRTTVTTTEEDG